MSGENMAVATEPQQERMRAHRRGLATFRSILSEDVQWQSFPAYPPSVHFAVLVGKPSESGSYVIRVKVPRGVKMMPHKHPEDRVYTILEGIFYVAVGDQFDAEKLVAFPPGSVIIIPGDTPHFHWARSSEYVAQVTAIGPLGFEYINPNDDPRT